MTNTEILSHIDHTVLKVDAKWEYRTARDAGFQNINVDLMHGLPGQTQVD